MLPDLKKKMNISNFHTHTNYCDGHGDAESFVIEAINKKIRAIGFSSHVPIPLKNKWSMNFDDLALYKNEINNLKKKYANKIQIYLSLEMDYIPGITLEFTYLKNLCNLDYSIGSVHLVSNKEKQLYWFIDGPQEGYAKGLGNVFEGDIKKAVKSYFGQINNMVKNERFDLLAHFDKVKMNNKGHFFNENEQWYKDEIKHSLNYIAGKKTIMEVNTRGLYTGKSDTLYPGVEVLEQCLMLNIPVAVSTDAHRPAELDGFYFETIEILKNIGFKKIMVFDSGKWIEIDINLFIYH